MFFITSVVPPSIEFARIRRNDFWIESSFIACSGRTIWYGPNSVPSAPSRSSAVE